MCFSTISQRGRFRFRFLENGSGGSLVSTVLTVWQTDSTVPLSGNFCGFTSATAVSQEMDGGASAPHSRGAETPIFQRVWTPGLRMAGAPTALFDKSAQFGCKKKFSMETDEKAANFPLIFGRWRCSSCRKRAAPVPQYRRFNRKNSSSHMRFH